MAPALPLASSTGSPAAQHPSQAALHLQVKQAAMPNSSSCDVHGFKPAVSCRSQTTSATMHIGPDGERMNFYDSKHVTCSRRRSTKNLSCKSKASWQSEETHHTGTTQLCEDLLVHWLIYDTLGEGWVDLCAVHHSKHGIAYSPRYLHWAPAWTCRQRMMHNISCWLRAGICGAVNSRSHMKH